MEETYDDDAVSENNDYIDDEPMGEDEAMNDETGEQMDMNDPHNKIVSYAQIINHIAKTPKITLPFLTKYEKTRIIGVRMQQLSMGDKPNIPTKGLHSIREIAEEELRQRKTPFIIRRPLPNNTFEYWKIEEFEKI